MAEDLNIDNISFEGSVIDGVSKIFLRSDLFVLPGLGGLAVSDALIHGIPVICSIGDGCEADLVVNDFNGYFEPGLDEDLLFEKMRFLLSNQNELGRMKKNCQESLQGKDIHAYIDTIKRAIESALAGRQ